MSEDIHYRCIDCGFETDVEDVGCGADHGTCWDLECWKCGGTLRFDEDFKKPAEAERRR